MFILVIDTGSNAGGVALSRNSEVIGVVMVKAPLRYAERLISYVDFLLRQHDLSLRDVDCFGVATGPGSFTGLRIGLATVKALAQAGGCPVVGIPSLEALAFRFRSMRELIAPVVDARRQEVYGAVYRVTGSTLTVQDQERVARPEDWLRSLPAAPYLFVGDGAQHYGETVRALHPQAFVLESDNCALSELSQLTYRRFTEGRFVGAGEVKANYVRSANAQLHKPRQR